jgi:hypothetical protein
MTTLSLATIERRHLIGGLIVAAAWTPLAAAAEQARVYDLEVHRSANCGCCLAWVSHMTGTGRFRANVVNEPDMGAVKRRLGVPSDLASCHTVSVDGFVIEGHVPGEDVLRLLSERPAGINGLAVPGMPRGSPGMETRDGGRDAYDVIAFGPNDARRVFSSYAAV